jgi:arylsulfatase A-like enzyme
MRKHGIRTNDWKYIEALEPDFHGLPPVELYDLNEKPVKETTNLVDARPDVVADLKGVLEDWITRRPAQTGRPNPIMEQGITMRSVG